MAFVPSLQAAVNNAELINKSGMQRMLSQRIAKAYFYSGNEISSKEAGLQMDMALHRFEKNHALLEENVQDSETRDLLSIVGSTFSEYSALTRKPYNKKNATRVLELSDTLLEICHSVVLNLQNLTGASIDHIINVSGKQRMLSQRVAKNYIAYQAGFRDEGTVQKLNDSVEEFEAGLNTLMAEKRNTHAIKELLAKVKKEWERVSPYFLKVRKGGLSIGVLTATDEITKISDRVTKLYVDEVAAAK
jgi:nitrate/nitrite-specific signal transduction histidine kinase